MGALAVAPRGCSKRSPAGEKRPDGPIRIVFKHQPLGSDTTPFRKLMADFERAHPGTVVDAQLLPAAPGAVQQYYLTALEGRTRDFDVFVIDVIWAAEFARAGWIAELSQAFPEATLRRDFLPGAADAALTGGRTAAVPWYVDVGVLYRRTDWAPTAPMTYDELLGVAGRARHAGGPKYGYLFQGLQSEGLVCNAYEVIWGYGGATMKDGRLLLDTHEARMALEYLRGLLVARVSPPSVTSMAEEESRQVFQAGDAVFMRNWPYAYPLAQEPSSKVRGRVAVSALPTLHGQPGHGTLGGFLIALNAHTPGWKLDAAHRFIAHVTSPAANLMLAVDYGRNPARRMTYLDPRVLHGAATIRALLPVVEQARPRPVTPYYPMIADTLAAEFSAALTGIRSPAEALRRAQAHADHLMEELT